MLLRLDELERPLFGLVTLPVIRLAFDRGVKFVTLFADPTSLFAPCLKDSARDFASSSPDSLLQEDALSSLSFDSKCCRQRSSTDLKFKNDEILIFFENNCKNY